ncbi:MAG TPA: hypothetical protein VNI82_00645 [Candidatus Nitrosotenuis sp.]|nr:hypothetical protein [Candidatus Nitrosotenuis sp.]
MSKKFINADVAVTAVSFRKNFETIPQRIEFRGVTYNFIGAGMRYLVSSGDRKTRLFDMTDGTAKFRLRNESGASNWTLVAITQ